MFHIKKTFQSATLLGLCMTTSPALAEAPEFEIHGLLQTWYTYQDDAGSAQAPGAVREEESGFSVRRAELAVKRDTDDPLGFTLMIDVSKNDKVLNDLFITYKFSDAVNLKVGQFLVPTGLQGLWPAGDLWLPERAWVGWRMADFRDIGISVSGQGGPLNYEVAVLNGNGPNTSNSGEVREIAGRVGFQPAPDVTVSLWADRVSDTNLLPERTSWGGDIIWKLEKGTFQAEYGNREYLTDEFGGYLQYGHNLPNDRQIVGRIDYYEGFGLSDNEEIAGEIGFNQFFGEKRDLKFQISLRGGTESGAGDDTSFVSMIAALQYGF